MSIRTELQSDLFYMQKILDMIEKGEGNKQGYSLYTITKTSGTLQCTKSKARRASGLINELALRGVEQTS